MPKYIELEEAIKNADFVHGRWDDQYISVKKLITIPSADVRPVVLCRHCKYKEASIWGAPLWCNRPEITPMMVSEDFFCAKGERE